MVQDRMLASEARIWKLEFGRYLFDLYHSSYLLSRIRELQIKAELAESVNSIGVAVIRNMRFVEPSRISKVLHILQVSLLSKEVGVLI